MSRRVMLQGVLYSAALVLQCITFLASFIVKEPHSIFAIGVLNSIFYPSQGLLNALIYAMPYFLQKMKKRRKAQQNISTSSNQDQQNKSSLSWLKSSFTFFDRSLILRKLNKSMSGVQDKVHGESKQKDVLESNNSRVDVSKQKYLTGDKTVENSDRGEQMLYLNVSSKSKGRNEEKIDDSKGEDFNPANSSSLMLLSCPEEEEAIEPSSFALSRNSKSKQEEKSSLQFSSALEVTSEVCNIVDIIDNKGNESDDESYVDDYLKMIDIE